MLTASQAYGIASQWGSFTGIGDPGACFCSFFFEDGRPVTEDHRRACLDYLNGDLIHRTKERIGLGIQCGRLEWRDEGLRDLRELRALRGFLETTELCPSETA